MTFVKGRSKLVFEVPDSVGESMVASGHVKRATEAEYRRQRKAAADPAPTPNAQTPPADNQPAGEAPVTEDDEKTDTADTGQETAAQAPQGEQGNPDADKPAGNASTDAWAAYALALGYSEEQVEGLGRDEIKNLVG